MNNPPEEYDPTNPVADPAHAAPVADTGVGLDWFQLLWGALTNHQVNSDEYARCVTLWLTQDKPVPVSRWILEHTDNQTGRLPSVVV